MKKLFKTLDKAKSWANHKVMAVNIALASLMLPSAALALDASNVEDEAKDVARFLTDMLGGWVGYTISLVVFFAGLFWYFKQRDLWGTMAAFGIAILIMVVPGVLEGFFSLEDD